MTVTRLSPRITPRNDFQRDHGQGDQSKIEVENRDLGSTEPLPLLIKGPRGVNGRSSDKTLIRRCLNREPSTPLRAGLKRPPTAPRPVPSARTRRTRRRAQGYLAKAGVVLLSATSDAK